MFTVIATRSPNGPKRMVATPKSFRARLVGRSVTETHYIKNCQMHHVIHVFFTCEP